MQKLSDLQTPPPRKIENLPMRFTALADAALAFYDTRQKTVDQNVDALKLVMRLAVSIEVPVGPNQSAKIEFRGPDPTQQTYHNLAAILKVMGEQA